MINKNVSVVIATLGEVSLKETIESLTKLFEIENV